MPILTVWPGGLDPAVVTFDRPLKPGTLAPTDWRFRYGGHLWVVSAATAVGSTVVLGINGTGPADPGPDAVWYLAQYRQVRGAVPPHPPAAAFDEFPIT